MRAEFCEPDHPDATCLPGRVLDPGGLCAEHFEAVSHPLLLHLGLAEMQLEDMGELGIAGDPAGTPHLHDRLLLDGVDIGQVLDELLLQGVGHRWGRCYPGRWS